MIGKAYQFNMQFDKAIEQYQAFYKSLKRSNQEKFSMLIYKCIDECNAGKTLVNNPSRVVITNAGDSVNSKYDDYNAFLIHKDSMMYFTSRRPKNKKQKPDKLNYLFDEDIYTSVNKSGKWTTASYLKDEGFNTKHNEAIVWVSADGLTRYLYDGYKKSGNILISTYKNNNWTYPKKIGKRFNTGMIKTSLSITADGNTIYFVSNQKNESFGGKDIFFCAKDKSGKWQEPQNIGNVINTKYDEESVYVTPEGNVLYFSSKGHNSMGGYDIFRSEKDANGDWQKPVNLGYPINTPDNELFYRPSADGKNAYFSAIRPDTHGGYDIYKASYLGSEQEMILTSDEQIIAYFNKPVSEIFARKPEIINIDTTFYIRGNITDSKTKIPLIAKIDLIDAEKSQVISTTISDSFGNYRSKLPQCKNYGIEIHARDYMFFLDVVKITPSDFQGREIIKNFALNKIEVGTKIVLKNIYFDSGKATLKPASYEELDKVVKFMQENSDLKIEISGHTDNQGSPIANKVLSENRAKSVVDYLIGHGIAQEHLIYIGYGLSQPIAPNTTAAGRQLNRRVEFKVLSKSN
jgi:outer membrane protein OmpA-like peptidoglycan-associated protein